MMSEEVTQTVCAGLLGAALYLRVLWMFGEAAFRGVFAYRLGEIQGKPARVIGVIGVLGMVSLLYIGLGVELNRQLPLWLVAGFFLALMVVMVLAVSLFGLFRLAFILFYFIFRFIWPRK
jgi:sterol desaturase/sphingolipid hydroxylase (fatty acid hydroxylase superfamily)